MKSTKTEAAIKLVWGVARKADFECLGLDDIKAIKSDREQPKYRPCDRAATKDESDPDEHTFTWQASTEHVDSMGDVIMVGGWDCTRVKNGMAHLLMGHDPDPLPAGLLNRASKSGKCEDGVRCLELTGRIYDQEIFGGSQFGLAVEGARKLMVKNLMKGSSVGFVPLEGGFKWPTEEERATMGMPPWGGIFVGQELLEHSITPIPANRNAAKRKEMRSAITELVNAGQLSVEAGEIFCDEIDAGEAGWLASVKSLKRTVIPVGKGLPWGSASTVKREEQTALQENPEAGAAIALAAKGAIESIEKACTEALSKIGREAPLLCRREVSRVMREMGDDAVDAITEAAEQIEGAVTRLGLKTAGSERVEVSREVGPNGPPASTAASTETSRDIATPPESRAGEALLMAITSTTVELDSANADRRSKAQGVQERQ